MKENELYKNAFDLYHNLPRIIALEDGTTDFVRTKALKKGSRDDFGNTSLITSAQSSSNTGKFIKKFENYLFKT